MNMITAIHLEPTSQNVDRVRWQRDTTGGRAGSCTDCCGDCEVATIGEVVRSLAEGTRIATRFVIDEVVVPGPDIVLTTGEDGSPRIQTAGDDALGVLSLSDLPRFD